MSNETETSNTSSTYENMQIGEVPFGEFYLFAEFMLDMFEDKPQKNGKVYLRKVLIEMLDCSPRIEPELIFWTKKLREADNDNANYVLTFFEELVHIIGLGSFTDQRQITKYFSSEF